jgi:Ca-activated chloride channel family protein
MSELLAGLRFAEPLWLLALLAGPLVVVAAWLRERRGRAVVFPSLSKISPRLVGGWRVRVRQLPAVLAGLGLMAGAVALARPQHGSERRDVTTQGVDIVVTLDISGSMAAEDFRPANRLAVAKEVVASFLRQRSRDRVGLVVFAGTSLTKAPPTTDTGLLLRQLEDVKLGQLPDGTAIGSGLATALNRLRHSKAASRVIVLVTDGANNAGEIDPETAAGIAAAMGVKVYTVLVGRGGRVPIPAPVQDPFTGRVITRTVMAEVDVDAGLLERIARQTEGEFFRAEDPQALRSIFTRIDELEKSEIKVFTYRRYRELYRPFLLATAVLLAAAALSWVAGLRVAPV